MPLTLRMDDTPEIELSAEEAKRLRTEHLIFLCWKCTREESDLVYHNVSDIPPDAVESFLRSE